MTSSVWPSLKTYDKHHLRKIALPLGGIGTGTVSLGGRGDLRDWEIMNRPAKTFTPLTARVGPLAAIRVKPAEGEPSASLLEGPLDPCDYEGAVGCTQTNHGFPRFAGAEFRTAYPLAEIAFDTKAFPVDVTLQAHNPMVPGNVQDSAYPVAVLRYQVSNPGDTAVDASVALVVPNFIGNDGSEKAGPVKENADSSSEPGIKAVNTFRQEDGLSGVFMETNGMDSTAPQWGTIAIATPECKNVSHRTHWEEKPWEYIKRHFWEEFLDTGRLTDSEEGHPLATLVVEKHIPAGSTVSFTFVIGWHFPNRLTWSPREDQYDNIIGNHYTTRFADAWDAVSSFMPRRAELEDMTVKFVKAFCTSHLPEVVKESALFNLSTLRSQTCFMTPDGMFYAWEGCRDSRGCCEGSCTHVWNYEHATAFLFGDLARKMRIIEFEHTTNDQGHMDFRVKLPLARSQHQNHETTAAADGQMGCIMKLYREWQLSGDNDFLQRLWPQAKRALEFCWTEHGWDGDRDGVMEGCQHNTMDVEYFGPNPQMQFWYLGALKAAAEMASALDDRDFAGLCLDLLEQGREWTEANLFNGDYYRHLIQPPTDGKIAAGLGQNPIYDDQDNLIHQLGEGCLVDQLIGQLTAHVLGLGYLADKDQIQTTLQSILRYNFKENFSDHFNHMRSYVLGDEAALLMATYPKGERPERPFPYFSEVMTGFEYTAAIHMLYEGMTQEGLKIFQAVRDRYDGWKRNPFDEAECGHHYGRAMVTWAAVVALSGFQYNGVEKIMTFQAPDGCYFWSTGDAWGTVTISGEQGDLQVIYGDVEVEKLLVNA